MYRNLEAIITPVYFGTFLQHTTLKVHYGYFEGFFVIVFVVDLR